NDKSYSAKVVGTDPNTDLAVLKIEANNLPYIVFANSNNVQIGQWVLACGYPLNLQTTVTAGIISAKSRNLGVNDEGTNPIDSYLQTDAAVNPGNSGGPLVDTEGKLVGINSAIATPTGSFAGYAYAIPSNIVRKVTNDILKYGTVQRAFLGVYLPNNQQNNGWNVSFTPNNNAIAGFKVIGTVPDGAAAEAGIQKGDVITGLGDDQINSEADLLGAIASHRPGDRVTITYVRDGKTHTAEVTLKNKNGTTGIVKATVLDELGAGLQTLPEKAAKEMGIEGGIVVTNLGSGLIKSQTDMQRGFIIVRAGDYPVSTVEQLQNALERQGNNVVLQGFYPNQQGMFNYAITDLKSGIVN
ncbi:MAG: trypsin-like peptidase domain-containing protein, partial [Chitinophagaceae bacterium]